jgi:hypothetical protein
VSTTAGCCLSGAGTSVTCIAPSLFASAAMKWN